MSISATDLSTFAREVRRLRHEAEQTLYPAYQLLIRSSYPDSHLPIHVDTNRHTQGTGFPDLTVLRGVYCLNWLEIKSPTVDVTHLPAADQKRFDNYRKTLPHVVLTNGHTWIVYKEGTEAHRLELPAQWLLGQQPLGSTNQERLIQFLRLIASYSPDNATSDEEAVGLLATAANLIRLTIEEGDELAYPAPLRTARDSFTHLLRINPADPTTMASSDFADSLAQTTVFGFLLARVESGAPVDPMTAATSLDSIEHPFLKNSLYGLVAPDPEMETLLKGPLRAACDMVNRAAPRFVGPQGDWSRITYLYEDFFAAYRPEDRFRYGVFYTPMEITRYQVNEVSQILKDKFGLTGINDPAVRFLDPACGTGTYLVALAERAAKEATDLGMPVGSTLYELFSQRVVGFEVSPGPACVAQARLAAWLKSRNVSLGTRLPIYTINSLTPPAIGAFKVTGNLWADNVSAEQAAGDKIKSEIPILVVLGNPPWGRRDRNEFAPDQDHNLLSAWAVGAGGAAQSIYDLYVAFWKFAVDLLLQRPDVQAPRGIVSYITNRTWLRGRPFTSMRGYLRDRNVVSWVTDLGGDARAGQVEQDQGVFAVMAGSAISTLAFGTDEEPHAWYRRILGTRAEKLASLSEEASWLPASNGRTDPLAPVDWGLLTDAPPVPDFFARSMPGIKTHRDDLVVSVSKEELLARLIEWNNLPNDEQRREQFHESRGRAVPSRQCVIDEAKIRHVRYRPLDDRWLYGDRKFIQEPGRIMAQYEESPHGRSLLVLDSSTVSGPVVIAAKGLPDYHSVRGSYGSHVLRVDSGDLFSGTLGVLSPWAQEWARSHGATIEDVASYLLALGNAPSYISLFGDPVRSNPPRLPATTDSKIFADAVTVGKPILDAWCLECSPAGQWKQVSPVGTPLGRASVLDVEVQFENGDKLIGLQPQIGQFEVSTYMVLERYLDARKHLTLTLGLAEDIRRLAGSIKTIVNSVTACDELLERALSGPYLDR